MMKYSTLLLVLIAGLFLGSFAEEDATTADDVSGSTDDVPPETSAEYVPRHPLTDMPAEADGVETTFLFPDNEDFTCVAGQQVELLGLFRNGGDVPLNVSAIMGSLNNPYDFRSYIQNYSMKMVGVQVPPGDDLTISYPFTPDANLHPRDFIVAVTVFYEGAGEMYSSTFFNSSIYIVEAPSSFDLQTLFMYIFILAIGGGIVFMSLRGLQSAGVVKKTKAVKRVETGTSKGTSGENEWLQGTNAYYNSGSKPKPKKVKKKN